MIIIIIIIMIMMIRIMRRRRRRIMMIIIINLFDIAQFDTNTIPSGLTTWDSGGVMPNLQHSCGGGGLSTDAG